jgi:hypothetical protein
MSRPTTGLLIIRAWVEKGSSKPLRAQVRLTTNVSFGITSEMTLAEISSVSAEVEAWLHDVLLAGIAASGNSSDA